MNEKPKIISTAYTDLLAQRLTPQGAGLRGVISRDRRVRTRTRSVVADAIRDNLDIADEVSLPTYAVKQVLGTGEYAEIVEGVHDIFQGLIAQRKQVGIAPPSKTLLSAGYVPDGYEPQRGEAVATVRRTIRPQVGAAGRLRILPVVEAATSFNRVRGAAQALNDSEVAQGRIGLAFDSDGALAADGATLGRVRDYFDSNPDKLDVDVALGANCGSLTGIDRAATAHPGALGFAYTNSRNPKHLREMIGLSNGDTLKCQEVSLEEAARVQCRHGFGSVGLCCGYFPKHLRVFRNLVRGD